MDSFADSPPTSDIGAPLEILVSLTTVFSSSLTGGIRGSCTGGGLLTSVIGAPLELLVSLATESISFFFVSDVVVGVGVPVPVGFFSSSKIDPLRSAPVRFAAVRLVPLRSAPMRLACWRSAE